MWLSLGTLSPNLDWQKFPNVVSESSLIRVSFATAGNFNKIFSYCWLRRAWVQTSPKLVEPAFRAYPKPEQIAYSVTIPEAFSEQGLILAEWECKLGFYRRNFSEPAWDISLEAWV
ncbi:MAG: hypothetical protein KME19_08990 [Microcoleus vaginatus WJT46-NPBG5]|nr:hypothetical protein [Microcoleus vaginatus WJT46-NPBG5]MBW4680236.1 hypothetical protein [Microcoleus vaginatus WJT46-NPBG5]